MSNTSLLHPSGTKHPHHKTPSLGLHLSLQTQQRRKGHFKVGSIASCPTTAVSIPWSDIGINRNTSDNLSVTINRYFIGNDASITLKNHYRPTDKKNIAIFIAQACTAARYRLSGGVGVDWFAYLHGAPVPVCLRWGTALHWYRRFVKLSVTHSYPLCGRCC